MLVARVFMNNHLRKLWVDFMMMFMFMHGRELEMLDLLSTVLYWPYNDIIHTEPTRAIISYANAQTTILHIETLMNNRMSFFILSF